MNVFVALIAGLIFGLGLIVSGMSDPAKVLAFLDLAGLWDPSLAFVMAGAIGVGLVAFQGFAARRKSLLGLPLRMPAARRIDHRLLGGGLVFGVGWGLAGICPGPALILVGEGVAEGLAFAAALLAGMALFEWQQRRSERRSETR